MNRTNWIIFIIHEMNFKGRCIGEVQRKSEGGVAMTEIHCMAPKRKKNIGTMELCSTICKKIRAFAGKRVVWKIFTLIKIRQNEQDNHCWVCSLICGSWIVYRYTNVFIHKHVGDWGKEGARGGEDRKVRMWAQVNVSKYVTHLRLSL